MNQIDLIVHNLEDSRKRSLKLWEGLPEEYYFWKPDKDAMNFLEMIRHVLGSDYWFNYIMNHRGNIEKFLEPWEGRQLMSLAGELEYFAPHRLSFINDIRKLSPDDLDNIELIRSDSGFKRRLGNFLLRVAYHEGVHAGQFLSYMRTLGIERPDVWTV